MDDDVIRPDPRSETRDRDHRRPRPLMQDPGAKDGAGGLAEKWDKHFVAVLIWNDRYDFIVSELLEDRPRRISSRYNAGARSPAQIIYEFVDAFIVGRSHDNMQLVAVIARPQTHALPVAEVSGDDNGALAFGEGLDDMLVALDLRGLIEVRLGPGSARKKVRRANAEVLERCRRDATPFTFGHIRKREQQVRHGRGPTPLSQSHQNPAKPRARLFDLRGRFALKPTLHAPHEPRGHRAHHFLLVKAHAVASLSTPENQTPARLAPHNRQSKTDTRHGRPVPES